MPEAKTYTDLSLFRVPKGFRGRSALFVQLWWSVQTFLVRPSPQVLYGWRRFWWRLFGAKVGKGVLIRPSAQVTYPWKVTIGDRAWIGDDVTLYSLGEIEIGEDAVISQGSYLSAGTHDYEKRDFPLLAKPIIVEKEVWIAARCFLAPGVRLGKGAVIGACSVVLKDIPEGMIAAGNPARILRKRPPAP